MVFRFNVRFGSKADMYNAKRDVRFTPESGHVSAAVHVRFGPIADIGRASIAVHDRMRKEESSNIVNRPRINLPQAFRPQT